MFYLINNHNLEETTLPYEQNEGKSSLIGYLTKEELEECYEQLNIPDAIVERCTTETSHFHSSIEVYDDYSFGIINIVNIMNAKEARDRIGIIIRRNMLLFVRIVDEDDSTLQFFNDSIQRFGQNATKEKILFGVLEKLIVEANKYLTITEAKILKMEEQIVEARIDSSLSKKIFQLRNHLSILNNYYEHLVDMGEELQNNSNDLFSGKDLRYFKVFTGRAFRLSASTKSQSDSLIHLREAHDASMNYELNRIMKVFTIVTVIFLPLTIIVGWYGMNFENMPEISWNYGYLYVILLSLLVLCGSIFFFKRKKLI